MVVARVISVSSTPKNAALSREELVEALSLLLDIVTVKKSFYVKPRDYALFFGYDHHKVTLIGLLLSRLAELGLAERHNKRRPLRYTLTPKWLWREFIKRCGNAKQRFKCETDSTACGLIGICPYWTLTQQGHTKR